MHEFIIQIGSVCQPPIPYGRRVDCACEQPGVLNEAPNGIELTVR
jgi:hypothetical protein